MITFRFIPASAEEKKAKFEITYDPADVADREKLDAFEETIKPYYSFISISGGNNVRTVSCSDKQYIEVVEKFLTEAKIDPEK